MKLIIYRLKNIKHILSLVSEYNKLCRVNRTLSLCGVSVYSPTFTKNIHRLTEIRADFRNMYGMSARTSTC